MCCYHYCAESSLEDIGYCQGELKGGKRRLPGELGHGLYKAIGDHALRVGGLYR